MKGLCKLADEHNLPIQSHISENVGEIDLVKRTFPTIKNYASVYDQYGLLNERTILAHGIYLTDEEIELMRERKTTISHCPLSNFSIVSGVLNVRKMLNRGVKVSLGSDISGGYSASMLSTIRNTLIATSVSATEHLRQHTIAGADDVPLTLDEVFYLATMGGAKALNIEDKVGNFKEGKSFDALIVDVDVRDACIDSFNDIYHRVFSQEEEEREKKILKENFARFIFNGDDRNITHIFVQGKEVAGQARQSFH